MDVLNQTAYASVSLHRYREAEAAAAEAALLARPQAASL